MGRKQIVKNLMCKQANDLTEEEIDEISEITDGLPHKFLKCVLNFLYILFDSRLFRC